MVSTSLTYCKSVILVSSYYTAAVWEVLLGRLSHLASVVLSHEIVAKRRLFVSFHVHQVG